MLPEIFKVDSNSKPTTQHVLSSYVIACCHLKNAVRTFKIERIEDIHIIADTYTIPSDFDDIDYLSSSWGIVVERI